MNAMWGHAIGVITLILMLLFIGIWIWAWLPSHRQTFDRLARIPLHDEMRDEPEDSES
jgi:cytochrome c oxidase cbb3-type subunit 4